MTDFEGCYLTSEGLKLSKKSGIDLVFTRVETGSGIYTSPEEIRNLSQLKDKKHDFQLEAVEQKEETADIIFYVTNDGVIDGYKLTEIGIYAKNESGAEILYCVAFAYENKSEMIDPEVAGQITYCRKFCVQAKVSATANVVAKIDGSDHEWEINYAKLLSDQSLLQQAFYNTFTYLEQPESQAMSSADILRAINTEWGGESSDDPNALSAAEVTAALSSEWNGETSSDPNALSAAQISEILAAPEGAQLSVAEIAALLS